MSGWDEDDALTVAVTLIIELIVIALDVLFAVVFACITVACWLLGFGGDE